MKIDAFNIRASKATLIEEEVGTIMRLVEKLAGHKPGMPPPWPPVNGKKKQSTRPWAEGEDK